MISSKILFTLSLIYSCFIDSAFCDMENKQINLKMSDNKDNDLILLQKIRSSSKTNLIDYKFLLSSLSQLRSKRSLQNKRTLTTDDCSGYICSRIVVAQVLKFAYKCKQFGKPRSNGRKTCRSCRKSGLCNSSAIIFS